MTARKDRWAGERGRGRGRREAGRGTDGVAEKARDGKKPARERARERQDLDRPGAVRKRDRAGCLVENHNGGVNGKSLRSCERARARARRFFRY